MSEKDLKYSTPLNKESFSHLIGLPLEEKVRVSKEIITEFCEQIDGTPYIACSFGKDSVVLVDIVRELFPKTPIIFANTLLEYKGVYKVRDLYDNVIEVFPIKEMKQIIKENGYILPIGKQKTYHLRMGRRHISNQHWESDSLKKLRGEAVKKDGSPSMFNCEDIAKYLCLPFPISEKCQYYLKDKPMQDYAREHNLKYSFVGITYDESSIRRASFYQYGFNLPQKSRPLGHWNTNDIFEYIFAKGLKISDSYGEIIIDKKGNYSPSLFNRTGCYCCPCGCHFETPNRYQKLYSYDRSAWEYSVYELGFGKVFDSFGIPYLPNARDPVKQSTLFERGWENE